MKFITKYHKECRIAFIRSALVCAGLALLFFPSFVLPESEGDNCFKIKVNGIDVGEAPDEETARECLKEARRLLSMESDDLTFVKTDMESEGEELWFGKTEGRDKLVQNMKSALDTTKISDRKIAYTIKVNEFTANIDSVESVRDILQSALDKYSENNPYKVDLIPDPEREINVLTTKVTDPNANINGQAQVFTAGLERSFKEMDAESQVFLRMDFDDYDYGLTDINYDDKVEIIEAFLPLGELMPVETAREVLTKDQEKPGIYEVKTGDTLSEIALNVDIPLDKIIEMNNELLTDENSTIRVGDELVITIPEPELSVKRQEEIYYEESFDADVEYVYNDNWFTNESVVRQQPSAGYRKVAALVTYHNNNVVDTNILKEVDTISAVPKIVEKGTKAPPSYIKPISGGRLTSPFGRRSAPKKGASTYHKGVDLATPVGTAVYASCGGTVARAGWGSGYGYVVYINHPDGRQTRYGHLSKVLVSVGQKVNQGEKIALSGNTGVSTGPHLHFEMQINGVAVDPLKYLQ